MNETADHNPVAPRPCDACGSMNYRPSLIASDLRVGIAGEFQLLRCATCGLVSLQPQPSFSELAPHYPDWLWRAEIDTDHSRNHQKNRALRRKFNVSLQALRRCHPQPGALLDVGCATGDFLQMAQANGWRGRGLEVSQAQVEAAREAGVEAEICMDFPAAPLADRYDAVTFNHVLEHVPSPRTYLSKAIGLLKPGGVILVAVPNFDSLSRRLFGRYWMHLDLPRHLFHFSPRTLSALFASLDCQILEVGFHDREQNALGLRNSAKRWLKYGVLRRSVEASGGETAPSDSTPSEIAPRRSGMALANTVREYSRLASAVTERLGIADTFTIVAAPRRHGRNP